MAAVQTYDVSATLDLPGVCRPVPVKVKYVAHPAIPAARDNPAERAFIEIQSMQVKIGEQWVAADALRNDELDVALQQLIGEVEYE
jgi:hypothetical protein